MTDKSEEEQEEETDLSPEAQISLNLAGHLCEDLINFIEQQNINMPPEHHETVKLFACLMGSALYHKVIIKDLKDDIKEKNLDEAVYGLLNQFINDPDIELSKHIKH
tara:strand:- start:125 stop:445 length:321 start_codon:yes stop_codon:yes gene_type:complete